jgi:hypothetical protein
MGAGGPKPATGLLGSPRGARESRAGPGAAQDADPTRPPSPPVQAASAAAGARAAARCAPRSAPAAGSSGSAGRERAAPLPGSPSKRMRHDPRDRGGLLHAALPAGARQALARLG